MPNNAEEIINGIIKAMEVMGFTKRRIKKLDIVIYNP